MLELDLVFVMEELYEYEEGDRTYLDVLRHLNPSLVCDYLLDGYWKNKRDRCKELGIGFYCMECKVLLHGM